MSLNSDERKSNTLRISEPGINGPTFQQFLGLINDAKKLYQEYNDKGDPFDLSKMNVKPKESGRMPVEEKATNQAGGLDSVKFDLVFLADGSTVKVNYSRKPQDPSGKGGGNAFSIDMSQFKYPEDTQKATAALTAFSQMIIEAQLKFHARGEPLTLYHGGSSPWAELERDVMQQQIIKNLPRFNALGINVLLGHRQNNSIFFDSNLYQKQLPNTPEGKRPEERTQQKKQKQKKPWDIPEPKLRF